MKLLPIITLITIVLLTSAVHAVTVVKYSDGSGYAYGIFKSNAATSESLTCARAEAVATNNSIGYSNVWCSAYDSNGNRAYCSSTNPEFAQRIKGLSDYGRLLIRWTADGECYAMQFVNATYYTE
ncbi:hypothetical protein [Pleionea sediminis]|uniref:hypothetical protein n=1 Tax=Pleionea sediminis TaxID=2569479 RepID=UPI001184D38D|nr:hypothetical protein [Pleionea sediminis]